MRTRILLLTLLTFTGLYGFTQSSNLSPYSRFGLGDIYQPGSVPMYGLGGVRSTYNDPYSINPSNPATLGSLFNTTFQSGIRYQSLELSEGDQTQSAGDGNLDQFFIALKRSGKKTGFIFGFTPFSTSGYTLTTEQTDTIVGDYTSSYEGVGGLNKAILGVGREFDIKKTHYFTTKEGAVYDSIRVTTQSISAGVNMNYFFGAIEQTGRIDLDDPTFIDTRRTSITRLNDVGFDFGFHYEYNFNVRYDKDKRLDSRNSVQLGIVYTPDLDLNANQEYTYENTITSSGVVFPLDTALFYDENGSFALPADIRAGIAFHRYNKEGRHFMIAADYTTRDWTQFSSSFEQDLLQGELLRSSELSVGFEYTPKPADDGDTFWSRANYRVGMRSAETYLSFDGEQVLDQAVTMGASFPILSSKSTSKIHLGMEFGRRGINEGVLIQEDYMNIHIGFSLSPFYRNQWFVERKYQ